MERLPRRYKVTTVTDVNEGRMQEARERFGCATCGSYGELVDHPEVDMVVVGMPQKLHCACSIEALSAGKDVVCEKPMAMNLAEADRSYNSEETPWSKEGVWRASTSVPDAQERYYIEPHKAIMEGEAAPVTAESVRRQMKLIEECHRRCKL